MPIEPQSKITNRLLPKAVLLAVIFASLAGISIAAPTDEQQSIRLRIAWGGQDAVRWAGRVSIANGQLNELSLLGRERDTPGSIWTDNDSVLVAQPRARTFDGFDITAVASPTSLLKIEMRAAGDKDSTVTEIPLADLMTTQHRSTMAASAAVNPTGTTLLVHRAQGDSLRVNIDRKHLIFSPNEMLAFTVEPAIAGLEAGGSIDLTAELVQGRRGTQEWNNTVRVSLPPRGYAKVPLEIPLPARDGVYTVKLSTRIPPGNRVKFWEASTNEQLAERTFQIVVLDRETPRHYASANWQTLLEIDPANPKWWDRLPNWTRFDRWASTAAKPMGSEPFRTTSHHGSPLAELSPNRQDAPSWQAYPLPAAEPGRPHVVEIDLPADYSQRLAIRIYEPNASGKLIPTGPGSGALVTSATEVKDGSLQSHHYLFWPRTASPIVVVENAGSSAARYGKLRLRVARDIASPTPTIDRRQRIAAGYFDWETMLDRTSARTPTADGRPPVDDWQTFYTAAERLAALLELSGYNTAVVNVMNNGSAAFDTGDFPTVPLLNSNRLVAGTTDLPAIDPLELTMRVFSRRGLQLMPALRFNATLPGIEAKLRKGEYRTIDEFPLWTNLAGQPRRKVQPHLATALAPHYRFAHPDVASEVQKVSAGLIAATKQHQAFAGIAIELSNDSYLASPPSEYGVTGPRLAQLANKVNADASTLDSWIKKPAILLGDATTRKQWNTLRAEPITQWFQNLASDVVAAKANATLMLLTPDLANSRELNVRPTLAGARSTGELYLEQGIDVQALAKTPGVLVPSVRHDTTGLPLADAAIPMELNARSLKTGQPNSGESMAAWQHATAVPLPHSTAFADSGLKSSLITFDMLGSATSATLTDSLYDDTGGPIVVGGPLGPGSIGDENRRAVLRQISQLPAKLATPLDATSDQPVVARVYRSENQSILLVVNDSPWPATASVTLDVKTRAMAAPLTSPTEEPMAPASYAAGRHAWPVTLGAYGTQALQFDNDQVSVTGILVQLSPDVGTMLESRCDELERRDLKPDSLAPYAPAPNPSFELTDNAGTATAWQSSAGNVPTVTPGVDGKQAAQISSAADGVSIASDPFPVPSTGQIALTAHVKVIQLAEDAELRLAVEEVGTTARPRYVSLSATRLMHDHKAKEWNAYQFGVEDLPFDSTAKMRIRIELIGAGELWVDNLEVHKLVYPLKIYPKESDRKVLALIQHVKGPRQAIEARQYRECQRMLNSYWSQFLTENLPAIESPLPESVAPNAPSSPAVQPKPAPRLTDRMRDWFRF